ncbi:hypothetical protein [Crocinitomix algicola]|uniref:hypothetical protein n=1 Tax=Crocinitomix algicola TaxID=1740263 RepID=UPI0008305B6C|nr:hypothetical protein [Crocinitomix algicola]
MTKWIFVAMWIVFALTACVEEDDVCRVCGNYELINLSKSHLVINENDGVSERKTLTVDGNIVDEFSSKWLWNEQKPDSSWCLHDIKTKGLKAGKFELNNDKTWEWKVVIAAEKRQNELSYTEVGTWKYLNNDHIILTQDFSTLNNREERASDSETISQSFKLEKDVMDNTLVLKSIHEKDSNTNLKETTPFSLVHGDIILTVKMEENHNVAANILQ